VFRSITLNQSGYRLVMNASKVGVRLLKQQIDRLHSIGLAV
jgi:hypothetical protein